MIKIVPIIGRPPKDGLARARIRLAGLLLLLTLFAARNVSAQVTYPDVAGIFFSRCASCHHENQHAPPFMNFTETSDKAPLIETMLQNNLMPPWTPDTSYTHFLNERSITPAEKNAILSWISDGALPGDTTLVPVAPVFAQYQLLGVPSKILQIPTFTSNATSTKDVYNCFSIPSGLTQDVWLRAFEIVPGNPEIVHHAVLTVDTAGTSSSDLSGSCFSQGGDFGLAGWAPGASATVFPGVAPLKAGIRLKAGCKIIIQLHYPKGTGGQKDSTQIRMYFYPPGTTGIRPMHSETLLQNWSLSIPANTTKTYTASLKATTPISVFAVDPHSHLVCTSLYNYADNGSTTIPLIRENVWDFNWQGFYVFPKMVKIPANYTLRSSHFYDNTLNNINNPNNPPLLVTAGFSTTDEMLFDSFQYLDYQAGDEDIDIGSLLSFDSLVTGTSTMLSLPPDGTGLYSIYPNPVTNDLVARYYLPKSGKAIFSIIDLAGKTAEQVKVVSQQGGFGNQRLSTSHLAPGVYILKLTSAGSTSAMRFTKF